ncbi:MAG: hypothetical protein WDW38_006538 [Sanguina aurantia]
MHPTTGVEEALERQLLCEGGPSTILVVGGRMSGKTAVCETVLKRMGRHVVRWTPYEEFLVGRVAKAYSECDTLVFVDDADVLVRLTKGSSVSLMDALRQCHKTPRIRIVLTALDTRGRVWRAVAACVDLVLTIPDAPDASASANPHRVRVERHGWQSLLVRSGHAVASCVMKNWCEARASEEDGDGEVDGGRDRGRVDTAHKPTEAEHGASTAEVAPEGEGCLVWKIAELLVR